MASQVLLNDLGSEGRGAAIPTGNIRAPAGLEKAAVLRDQAESALFVTHAIDRLLSSAPLGWSDIFAAQAHEEPHAAEHGTGPLLWITMPLTPVRIERRLDGRPDVADQGAFSINMARPQSLLRAEIDRPADLFHLFLRPALLTEVAAELTGRDMADVAIRPVFDAGDNGLSWLLRSVKKSLAEPAEVSRLKIDYLARALSADLLAKYVDGPITLRTQDLARGGLGSRQLARVRDYIEAHLADDIHVNDLAAIVGVGRTAFTVHFRASTGVSPYQYVMGLRVERAKTLLAQGRMSLAEIAIACGFADQAHFATTFKRRAGVRPLDFRRR